MKRCQPSEFDIEVMFTYAIHPQFGRENSQKHTKTIYQVPSLVALSFTLYFFFFVGYKTLIRYHLIFISYHYD